MENSDYHAHPAIGAGPWLQTWLGAQDAGAAGTVTVCEVPAIRASAWGAMGYDSFIGNDPDHPLHPLHPVMTTTQEIAAKLAAQGMDRAEMIAFIYGCTTYATLDEVTKAVDQAI